MDGVYLYLMVILAVSCCDGRRRPRLTGRQRDATRARLNQHRLQFGIGLDSFFGADFQSGHGGDSWWKGPNVCQNQDEETDTNDPHPAQYWISSQSCDVSETSFKCKTTYHTKEGRRHVTTVYHCCHGYRREKGEFGCSKVPSLTDLMATAQEHDLSDFVRAVRLLKWESLLKDSNLTVFAPANGAFDLNSGALTNHVIPKDTPDVLSVSASDAEEAFLSLAKLVAGHLVKEGHTTDTMGDESLMTTALEQNSSIRINYFRRPETSPTSFWSRSRQPPAMMANCVPVVTRDILATNGVLHVVAKTLTPVTETLLDLVKRREDLSTLKTVLAAAEYVSTLNDEGSFTLLAPTNYAFDRMDRRLRERLLRGDKNCVKKVLQNHLLRHVICAGALTGEHRTPNLLHKLVNLTLTPEGKMFAGAAQVVQTDAMATNGVMHVLDQVLVPDEALDYLDILEQQGFTELTSLIEKAGLTKTLEKTNNVTVFAPTNQAIQSMPESVKKQLEDKEFLKEVLSFHVSPGVSDGRRLHDNMMLSTLSGTDVRINTYRASPMNRNHIKTAQCAPIKQTNLQACNGVINVISELMVPPPGNVLDVLALDRRFSQFVGLLKLSGIADTLQGDGPFTVFAPNNEAFEKLNLGDHAEDKDLIKRHIFQNALCCAGIQRNSWMYHPHVRAMSGDEHKLRRGAEHLSVGGARVVTCDRTATNGVVLELDTVLPHQRKRFHSRGFDMSWLQKLFHQLPSRYHHS